MALHNEILVGRFNRFLQKHLGMKGHPPAPQLASDIGVSLNLHSDAENLYLEGWEAFGVNVLQPASAGNVNELRLRNPTGSNVIAVVYTILVGVHGSNRVICEFATPGLDLGTSQTTAVRGLDGRTRPS